MIIEIWWLIRDLPLKELVALSKLRDISKPQFPCLSCCYLPFPLMGDKTKITHPRHVAWYIEFSHFNSNVKFAASTAFIYFLSPFVT